MFRVLFLIAGLFFMGSNAFGVVCANSKAVGTTTCTVGDNPSGEFHAITNGNAGHNATSSDLAHLNAPGLCDAKGMDVTKFCASPNGGWIPTHWYIGSGHPCQTVFELVYCAGSACNCE